MTEEKYNMMKDDMKNQVKNLNEDLNNPDNFKRNVSQDDLIYITNEGDEKDVNE